MKAPRKESARSRRNRLARARRFGKPRRNPTAPTSKYATLHARIERADAELLNRVLSRQVSAVARRLLVRRALLVNALTAYAAGARKAWRRRDRE